MKYIVLLVCFTVSVFGEESFSPPLKNQTTERTEKCKKIQQFQKILRAQKEFFFSHFAVFCGQVHQLDLLRKQRIQRDLPDFP
jgi:hypothetical protein